MHLPIICFIKKGSLEGIYTGMFYMRLSGWNFIHLAGFYMYLECRQGWQICKYQEKLLSFLYNPCRCSRVTSLMTHMGPESVAVFWAVAAWNVKVYPAKYSLLFYGRYYTISCLLKQNNYSHLWKTSFCCLHTEAASSGLRENVKLPK